jgi:flagellar L-ring protein precursor FlgH
MNLTSLSVLLSITLASALTASAGAADDPLPLVLPSGIAMPVDQGLAAQSPLMRARLQAATGRPARYSQLPQARDWAAEDLIQIVVVEQSTEKIDQRRQLEKEGVAQAEVAEFSSFDFGAFTFSPTTSAQLPGVEIGAEKEFEGQGRYQRKDEMSDRFTAKVVEVKPNGNLVVEARVVRNWSGDQTEITLTGVVNPKWITANDAVLSTQIADLKIDKNHSGPVEGTTQRGVLAEVLDFLFAF